MIENLLGSHVKASILMYLGLKGGAAGREISRALKIHTTQVFKALKQLCDVKIIHHYESFYALNPFHLFHEEIMRMIWKEAEKNKKFSRRFLPTIKEDRHVDPLAVYEIAALRKEKLAYPRLSDVLRAHYG